MHKHVSSAGGDPRRPHAECARPRLQTTTQVPLPLAQCVEAELSPCFIRIERDHTGRRGAAHQQPRRTKRPTAPRNKTRGCHNQYAAPIPIPPDHTTQTQASSRPRNTPHASHPLFPLAKKRTDSSSSAMRSAERRLTRATDTADGRADSADRRATNVVDDTAAAPTKAGEPMATVGDAGVGERGDWGDWERRSAWGRKTGTSGDDGETKQRGGNAGAKVMVGVRNDGNDGTGDGRCGEGGGGGGRAMAAAAGWAQALPDPPRAAKSPSPPAHRASRRAVGGPPREWNMGRRVARDQVRGGGAGPCPASADPPRFVCGGHITPRRSRWWRSACRLVDPSDRTLLPYGEVDAKSSVTKFTRASSEFSTPAERTAPSSALLSAGDSSGTKAADRCHTTVRYDGGDASPLPA